MACEVDSRQGFFCSRIYTLHIIFFQINMLLLSYQEFGSKSLNILKLTTHNLLFPFSF